MTFRDDVEAMRKAHDEEMVVVIPMLPVKQAMSEWALWLAKHPGCRFAGHEILISTGRAKNDQVFFDYSMYQVKRAALRREGIQL